MPDRSARRLVLAGTLLLAAVAGEFVRRFGADLPNTDEWDFAGPLTAARFPWGWLLGHHNEHRYPLARLLWLGLVRATGDFRAPMLLTVGLLLAACLLLMAAARRWRGSSSVGDVVVPALLLHWGHAFNLLMGYQVAFGLFAVGLAGVAWAGVAGRPHLGGLFAAVAVQSGGFGLAAAPPLVAWLARVGLTQKRSVLGWPLLLTGYAGWVVATLPATGGRPAGSGDPVVGTAAYLAVGLGLWVPPLGRTAWLVAAAGVLAVGLAAVVAARRSGGLLATLAAAGLAAAAVGYGRGEWAVAVRFILPSAVGLAVAWVPVGRRAGWVGLPLAGLLLLANTPEGLRYGKLVRPQVRSFEADLRAGELPPVFLAGRHASGLQFLSAESLAAGLTGLRDGNARRFRHLPADPPFTVIPARFEPTRLAVGPEPFLPGGPPPPAVRFDPPGPVVGLRVRGEQQFPIGYAVLRVRWTDAGGTARTAEAFPKVVPGRFAVAFPLGGVVRDVRLEPACPMLGLDLLGADWLVPGGV